MPSMESWYGLEAEVATWIRDCSRMMARTQGKPASTKTPPNKTFCRIGSLRCFIQGSAIPATAKSKTIAVVELIIHITILLKHRPDRSGYQDFSTGKQMNRLLKKDQNILRMSSTRSDLTNHLAKPNAACGKIRMHCKMTERRARPIDR